MKGWLNNATRRAKEGLMQAVGVHQKTTDTEFDIRSKEFADHINELFKLKDALELWIDSFDSFCSASLLLSRSFQTYYENANVTPAGGCNKKPAAYRSVSQATHLAMLDLHEFVNKSIRTVFISRCIRPLIQILSYVPQINKLIQDRKTLLLDFDSYRSQIHSMVSSGKAFTHPSVVKVTVKLDDANLRLTQSQVKIYQWFDEFDSLRPVLLGPEFAAFLGCFYFQSEMSSALIGSVLPFIPQSASTLCLLKQSTPPSEMLRSGIMVQNLNSKIMNDLGSLSSSASSSRKGELVIDMKDAPFESIIVDPIYQRSDAAGGTEGGYGSITSILEKNAAELFENSLPTSMKSLGQAVESLDRIAMEQARDSISSLEIISPEDVREDVVSFEMSTSSSDFGRNNDIVNLSDSDRIGNNIQNVSGVFYYDKNINSSFGTNIDSSSEATNVNCNIEQQSDFDIKPERLSSQANEFSASLSQLLSRLDTVVEMQNQEEQREARESVPLLSLNESLEVKEDLSPQVEPYLALSNDELELRSSSRKSDSIPNIDSLSEISTTSEGSPAVDDVTISEVLPLIEASHKDDNLEFSSSPNSLDSRVFSDDTNCDVDMKGSGAIPPISQEQALVGTVDKLSVRIKPPKPPKPGRNG